MKSKGGGGGGLQNLSFKKLPNIRSYRHKDPKMRLNGSNIGTFLKSGQNRPFFHPLILENFKTIFFQKFPMDILDFGHFGFRGIYIKWCKWSFHWTQKKVLIWFKTAVAWIDKSGDIDSFTEISK